VLTVKFHCTVGFQIGSKTATAGVRQQLRRRFKSEGCNEGIGSSAEALTVRTWGTGTGVTAPRYAEQVSVRPGTRRRPQCRKEAMVSNAIA
jgi:hypothetical protein